MSKLNVAFLEGHFSSLSKLFNLLLIGWIKAGPPKKVTSVWPCKQAIRAALEKQT